MKILDLEETTILTEGQDILYHATTTEAAAKILQLGKFKLSNAVGDKSEKQLMHKGYQYFLSTSRNKTSQFHIKGNLFIVMMNLDGRWINQRYPIKPIDYFKATYARSEHIKTIDEMEDRIYSKNSEMSITPIQEIHIYLKTKYLKDIKQVIILTKQKNIPVFLYDDLNAWIAQNKKKTISVKQAKEYLRKPDDKITPKPYHTISSIKSWLELYYKDKIKNLSANAKKKMEGLMSGFSLDELQDAFDNTDTPQKQYYEDGIKFVNIMRKNKWRTLEDFINAMRNKWIPKWYQQVNGVNEDVLTEANRQSIILVDFQPSYDFASGYDDAIEQAIEYINQHPNIRVNAFFNGSDVGVEDSKEDVIWHYMEHGLDEDRTNNIRLHEKTYAFLRDWMNEGIDESTIIKTIRYMVMNRINDTRDIDEEVLKELLQDDFNDDMIMYIPDISISNLKQLSRSLLGGGAEHECLKELQILMNAFNIKYKLVDKWIYGG